MPACCDVLVGGCFREVLLLASAFKPASTFKPGPSLRQEMFFASTKSKAGKMMPLSWTVVITCVSHVINNRHGHTPVEEHLFVKCIIRCNLVLYTM